MNALSAPLRGSLRLLLQAWDYGQQCQHDPWDFAVEIVDLRATGLTTAELRLLFCEGRVQHAVEQTKPGANHRRFGTSGGLVFCEKSCFVLTEAGAAIARALEPEAVLVVPEEVPHYDHGKLWFHKHLVKWFQQPASEQDIILSSFEEEHWKHHIYSPLSPRNYDEDPKLHLRRAIRRLKLHQINRLINFLADGRGEGICWEPWNEEALERRC